MMLGNLEYEDGNGNKHYVNLAHIPISLEVYSDFMIKNIISKDLNFYSLMRFFDDLVKDLVLDLFNSECFGGLLSVDSRSSTTFIESESGLNVKSSTLYKNPPTAPNKHKVVWASQAGVSGSTPPE